MASAATTVAARRGGCPVGIGPAYALLPVARGVETVMPPTTRLGVAAAVCAMASTWAVASASAAPECAPKPDNPVGYQVTAVHADAVAPPQTTPPIAVLDSGVAAVPELEGRLRPGADLTTAGPHALHPT